MPTATAAVSRTNSLRTIPIHPALVQEGFLRYVAGLPAASPLFPDVKPDKTFGLRGVTASKRVGRWVRSLGIGDARISPTHSSQRLVSSGLVGVSPCMLRCGVERPDRTQCQARRKRRLGRRHEDDDAEKSIADAIWTEGPVSGVAGNAIPLTPHQASMTPPYVRTGPPHSHRARGDVAGRHNLRRSPEVPWPPSKAASVRGRAEQR